MGTMSEVMVASMLRSFQLAQVIAQTQREADLAALADKPPVWRWSPGTFVFPEGLCCYCGGVMRSPCIFRAVDQQYYGSWKVVGGPDGVGHFEFDGEHPHANAGSICMGSGGYSAQSTADALFLAFNPTSMYFGGGTDQLKTWFADRFDHSCRDKREVRTIEGVDLAHAVAPVSGCHCAHCRRHRNEEQCPLCQEWYSRGRGHGRFACRRCESTFCVKHKHRVEYCVHCRYAEDQFDGATGQAIANPYLEQCEKCSKYVCRHCMESRHACAQPAGAETAAEAEDAEELYSPDHDCCGCEVCCECGAENENY